MNRIPVYPARTEGGLETPVRAPDGFSDKLLKYIPGEVIAFFIPAHALVRGLSVELQGVIWGLGIAGTVGYLYARSEKAEAPPWYFYALAAAAFVGWSFGTTSVGMDLFGLSEELKEITILAAVFLVPLGDEVITRMRA